MKLLLFAFIISTIFLVIMNPKNTDAAHSVSTSPPGGTYNTSQSVTIESTISNSTIYYTIDGTDPTNSSSLYIGPLNIEISTTLKFMAIDMSDNHTSATVIEKYVIDTIPPNVTSTEPAANATKVDILQFSTINATFSEAMDASTINGDTFTIFFGGDPLNIVSGSVEYHVEWNTTSFILDEPLEVGRIYTATLTDDIKDVAGNPLPEDFIWNFTTGGQFTIVLLDLQASEPPGPVGSAFTITPNPFTLSGSLKVDDNGDFDSDIIVFGEQFDGAITLRNVELSTYVLTETTVPDGFAKVYDHVILTVHETKPDSIVFIRNRDASIPLEDITDPIAVPAPDLNITQFEIYKDNAFLGLFSGRFGDVPAGASEIFNVGPDAVPFASITTSDQALDQLLDQAPLALIFTKTAPATSTGKDIFESFQIPTYPDPEQTVAGDIVYFVPAYVIPYDDSENNFIVTPVIGKVYAGMTLLMNQSSFAESELAEVKRLNMTFNSEGSNVGFSFGIRDEPPPGTPPPPLDVPALFLDIGFVGDIDFSDPNAFESSPKIDILVNKTLPGFDQLPDGCTDFVMLFFDEDDNEWKTIQKLRNPTIDTEDECGFTLLPEHFSTFAVGGVKGSTLVTEAVLGSVGGGGGGGSSSTSIRQMVSGENVLVTTDVGTTTVISRFEFVEPGSGQLKIESGPITNFDELFDEIVNVGEESQKQGIVQLNDAEYSTVGTIFDVDATDVNFRGMFDITIPYKEDIVSLSFGSESDVRLLHYNTELMQWEDVTIAVDQGTNTVTGRMNSSSPVVAALLMPVDNPTKTFRMSDVTILDPVTNLKRLEITKGEVVTVTVMLENMAPSSSDGQTFVFIVEVLDENGMATDISVQNGSLDGRNSIELARSWTENETGLYNLKIFVWTDLVEPSALSDVATTQVRVS